MEHGPEIGYSLLTRVVFGMTTWLLFFSQRYWKRI